MSAKKPAAKPVATLADLTPDPQNARKHNPRNIGQVQSSLQKYGAARSIVIDENNQIIAGHGVVEAAGLAGIERVQVVEADGETIIAVRRSGLTKKQKIELGIADNRGAELAEWDTEVLKGWAGSDIDLEQFWNKAEWEQLVPPTAGNDAADPGAQVDKAAELQAKWGTALGQLWAIGRHRLLVGDCTVAGNVARLMGGEKASATITDPPYNVSIDYGEEVDDAKTLEAYETFSRAWFALACEFSERQIVTPGGVNHITWARFFESKHVGVWIKTNALTRGRVSNSWCWEPVFFHGEKWLRLRSNDVFDYPIGQQKDVGDHPCPKPLPMWVDLVENYTEPSAIVFEPFSGSGTTHVACEKTGRACYGTELEAKYAAVTLERLHGLGLTPELLP